jgi:hypothetical protein
MRSLMLTLLLGAAAYAQPAPDLAAQKEAMKKLSFLVGTWKGPATANLPGGPIQVTQTEEVQYKLDGSVLLVEGTGRTPDGVVRFNALATISYDGSAKQYRIRAHTDGHYLDTVLTATAKGFEWSRPAGPGKVVFKMVLNEKGQWHETGEFSMPGQPPQKAIELLVTKQ